MSQKTRRLTPWFLYLLSSLPLGQVVLGSEHESPSSASATSASVSVSSQLPSRRSSTFTRVKYVRPDPSHEFLIHTRLWKENSDIPPVGDKFVQIDVRLLLADDHLEIHGAEFGRPLTNVQYSIIDFAEYTRSKHPRPGAIIDPDFARVAEAIGLFEKKHWLILHLQLEGDSGLISHGAEQLAERRCVHFEVLQLDKRNADSVIAELEAKADIKVLRVPRKAKPWPLQWVWRGSQPKQERKVEQSDPESWRIWGKVTEEIRHDWVMKRFGPKREISPFSETEAEPATVLDCACATKPEDELGCLFKATWEPPPFYPSLSVFDPASGYHFRPFTECSTEEQCLSALREGLKFRATFDALWELALDWEQSKKKTLVFVESLYSLASLYQARANLKEAEKFYFSLDPEESKERIIRLANSLQRLASLYAVQGKYADAAALIERALPIIEQARGLGHSQMATSLRSLAALRRAQGKHREAQLLNKRALSILERKPEYPSVATNVQTYGGILRELDRNVAQDSFGVRTATGHAGEVK